MLKLEVLVQNSFMYGKLNNEGPRVLPRGINELRPSFFSEVDVSPEFGMH